jgi:hypothetical protein
MTANDTTAAAQVPAPTDKRRASRDRLLADLSVVEPTPEQRRRAALAVCHFNPDTDEAREMLDALGLLGDEALHGSMPVAS